MRPFGLGAADFLINGRAAPNMKKVIRMLFVFFSSPSLLHPSCGLFVCQASSAHPPPKTPAPPPHPARKTEKRAKRQKKSRQKLNLIPYQKKPSLRKSKIFNLENDKEVLAFLGVRAVCVPSCSLPVGRLALCSQLKTTKPWLAVVLDQTSPSPGVTVYVPSSHSPLAP